MPRDLFGDVTRPSISIGNRKWYSVPVSLLSHSVILAMFVVLPILAAPLMPHVLDNEDTAYLIDVLPPPPLPPPKRPPQPLEPVADPNIAPVNAPDTIAPEPPPRDPVGPDVPGLIAGPIDVGSTVLAPPPVAVVKPPEQKPLPVGGNIRRPIKIGGNDPVYPAMARAAGVQGMVIIEATIGADGHVMNARILRSVLLLDQAALEAVRQWQYTPTLLNGVPVPVVMTVTVTFTLSK